ncbi:hypothetical protein CR513_01465, partial [Mucuna pruriens]
MRSNKILKCLNGTCKKFTTTVESRALKAMDIVTLFEKLKEQEIQLNMLALEDEEEKPKRNIFLQRSKNNDSDLDDKDMLLLAK